MPTLAALLLSVVGRYRKTPQIVDSGSHSFQVFRIDTASVTAQMVNLEPVRNRAEEVFIDDTVCIEIAAIDCDSAITLRRWAARPVKAPVFGSADFAGEWRLFDADTFRQRVPRCDFHLTSAVVFGVTGQHPPVQRVHYAAIPIWPVLT